MPFYQHRLQVFGSPVILRKRNATRGVPTKDLFIPLAIAAPKLQQTQMDPGAECGKAEPFIQTALREWAYARAYDNSQVRGAELPRWIYQYNCHRPHASLNHAPPVSRSGLDRNNLLSHHT